LCLYLGLFLLSAVPPMTSRFLVDGGVKSSSDVGGDNVLLLPGVTLGPEAWGEDWDMSWLWLVVSGACNSCPAAAA
jgi:hypothetical protein